MPTFDYDAIIVGAGLGGLSAAASLAVNGANVLVQEQGDSPGGFCRTLSIDGYRFDLGPSVFTGFTSDHPMGNLFQTINMEHKLKKTSFVRQLEPGPQVLLPGRRVTLYPELARLLRELEREYPEYLKLMERLYLSLLAGKSKDKKRVLIRSVKGIPVDMDIKVIWLTQRLLSHPQLRDYFKTLTHFVSPYGDNLTAVSASYILSYLLNPFYMFRNGSSSLPQLLIDVIKDNGGEVQYGAVVEGLIREGRRVIGTEVSFKSVGQQIIAPEVILNCSFLSSWKELLNNGLSSKAGTDSTAGVLPFSLVLGIKDDALPEYLSPFALAQFCGIENAASKYVVRLALNPLWCEDWAPPNERTLKASTFINAADDQQNDSRVYAGLTQSILEALTSVIPYLRKNITFMKIFTPKDYLKMRGRAGQSLTRSDADSGRHKRKRPAIAAPAAGLHLVGSDILGEFGAQAAIRSGLNVGATLSARK